MNINELAISLNVKPSYIYKVFNRSKQPDAYIEFQIPSKNRHGFRDIAKPCDEIKIFQKKLLKFFEEKIYLKACVHGFVKGKSNVTNARRHIGRTCVLNIDLENFFPSINFGRVRGILMCEPLYFNAKCATIISQICCYERKLPQGAPTSPILANLIASKLDNAFVNLSRTLRVEYTRYADDLSFSTRRNNFPKSMVVISENEDGDDGASVVEVGDAIRNIIEKNGFAINESKTRLSRYGTQRKCVTGIVVNEKCNLKRGYYRNLRAALFECNRDINVAMRKSSKTTEQALKNWITGKIAYYKSVVGAGHSSYNKICHEYNKIFGETYKCIDFELTTLENEAVFRTTLSVPNTGQILFGTAFNLHGAGLVTNKHVLNLKYNKNKLSESEKLSIKSNIVIYKSQCRELDCTITDIELIPNRDIAIVKFEASEYIPYFKKRETAICKTEPHILLGYPGRKIDDEINVRRGVYIASTITDLNTEQQFYALSGTAVLFGNSGGPLIDHRNHVVGIATLGGKTVQQCISSKEVFNGALPISYLNLTPKQLHAM